MRALLIIALFGGVGLNAQTSTEQYFAYSGASYDWIGRLPASVTGFGLRIGNSNAFSVTEIATSVQAGQSLSSIQTGLEYQMKCTQGFCLSALGSAGASVTGTSALGNFSGGFGLAYDIGSLLTHGKFSLFADFQFRIMDITATQAKPVYALEFRKGF